MSENTTQPISDAEWAEQKQYTHGSLETEPRALSVIAAEIRADWKRPYFGAVPYLEAMETLTRITDSYWADSAASIVRYFLANAGTWRGETARRVKAELNALVKGQY